MQSYRSKFFVICLVFLIAGQLVSAGFSSQAAAAEEGSASSASPVNVLEGATIHDKSSDTSNGRAANILSAGTESYWSALASDRLDDLNVWIAVKLEAPKKFDKVSIHVNRDRYISNIKIQYSSNGEDWNVAYDQAYSGSSSTAKTIAAAFDEVTALYMRVDFSMVPNTNVGSAPNDTQYYELQAFLTESEEPGTGEPEPQPEPLTGNLVLGQTNVKRSSDLSSAKAEYAFDGNATTVWQPQKTDREDDKNVWMSVDLGQTVTFNHIVITFNAGAIDKYQILYSNDGVNWQEALVRDRNVRPIQGIEDVIFDAVSGSHIKLNVDLAATSNFQVAEFEVYHTTGVVPAPQDLESIYLVKEDGTPYALNEQVVLQKGQAFDLQLKGKLAGGQEDELTGVRRSFVGSSGSISISQSGTVTALKSGANRVYAYILVGDQILMTPDFWVVVEDEEKFLKEAIVANTSLTHPTMAVEIGEPAVIAPGAQYPVVSVQSNVNGILHAQLLRDGAPVNIAIDDIQLTKGTTNHTIAIPGNVTEKGSYEIRLTIEPNSENNNPALQPVYDSFYFTVMEAGDVPAGQSKIAYLNSADKLEYVPDFKGNQIIDFSNVGYKGLGGTALPDVQAKVVVEPGPGDDTARIQAAIDQVSAMPLDANGFRGAVVLKVGTFEIASTLYINQSGVVLRGMGEDEDGTILLGTGTSRRNLIEVGPKSAPVLVENTKTEISNLYVPSGATVFRVEDASQYQVGDTVMIRRQGNEDWIHEIGMDHIYMRPGTTSGTLQWTPFNLDFDRVITKIEGNTITIDAPLANAIERKWGGGQLYKYTDVNRIENIGIEKISAVSEYDPSITDTQMDNEFLDEPYFADEDHAERFVMLNAVKNAWVRNVSGHHLSYALVQIGREAKWVTVQDAEVYDMVSIITGGRRYSLFIQGQLNFVQRIYAETSRHAFVYDSRVQGPNVVYDSLAVKEYNTSEPHHRWSVGGLFDNVDARINIRDRAWLGSGHGWSGANYVSWNTKGGLVSQQPPTAQNYVIGHEPHNIGKVVEALVPNEYDPRPRSNGYWEYATTSVNGPESLYVQQLAEKLQISYAATEIKMAKKAVGGGSLDNPDGITEGGHHGGNGGSYVVTEPQGIARKQGDYETTLTLNQEAIEAYAKKHLVEGTLSIDASADKGNLIIELSSAVVKYLQERVAQPRIQAITPFGAVELPIDSRALQRAANEMQSDNIIYQLRIQEVSAAVQEQMSAFAAANQFTSNRSLLLVQFSASSDGRSIDLLDNGSLTILLGDIALDPSNSTIAAFDSAANVIKFRPAIFEKTDKGWQVRISRADSNNYMLITQNKTFADLAGHRDEQAIRLLANKGILQGKSENIFAPDHAVTRAQLAALVVRMLNLKMSENSLSFADVADQAWYAGDVAAAASHNLIQGYSNGDFRPNQAVTQEEAAVILHRALLLMEKMNQIEQPAASNAACASGQNAASWAKDAVCQLGAINVLGSDAANPFMAKNHMNRGEFALVAMRLLAYMEFINK
ncbi:discoidin domain-containing protein [Paenibacillus sp. GXUN7292]|uniref:discoidin domain-containing protein n=1 Tax=Paenibacillus sp. GXUN7292 TaxID=3422499 RepID=UPI003D7E7C87